jgi:hypothetical protein
MPIYTYDDTANPVTELGDNRRIQVTINPLTFNVSAADGTTLDATNRLVFYTHATPVYASVEYILLNGGEMLEGLPEAAVYLMSFAQSTLVDQMILHDPADITDSLQLRYFNRAKAEFVKCKAAADMLRAVVSSRGTSVGRKTLADFSIDTSALGNLLSQARAYLSEFADCYKFWQTVLYAGGRADHFLPEPQSAVKAGHNSNAAGIGRGWIVGGTTLNNRESTYLSGDTYSRPRAFGSPLTAGQGVFPHHDDHLQHLRGHHDPDVGS